MFRSIHVQRKPKHMYFETCNTLASYLQSDIFTLAITLHSQFQSQSNSEILLQHAKSLHLMKDLFCDCMHACSMNTIQTYFIM